jgi:hypothetical protein
MFVDYAVEPFYYEKGIDFYEDGQNYAMASLLSVAGPTLLGPPAFDRLLASFQHAVKEKTPQALQALVTAARATKWREFPEALGPLARYAAPECLSAIANPAYRFPKICELLHTSLSGFAISSRFFMCRMRYGGDVPPAAGKWPCR